MYTVSPKKLLNQMGQSVFHWGMITNVDSENYTMSVRIASDNGMEVKGIRINQALSHTGGTRQVFMPVPNETHALLAKTDIDETGFTHLGYYTPDGANTTSDRANTKTGSFVYQRYLKPGEYQVVSISGTELYMPESGDFFVKNSKGYFIRFSPVMDNLEVYVPDTHIQNYSVDIKSGRVVRTSSVTLRDEIKRNMTTKEPFHEFSINLGTLYNQNTSLPTGVRTGSITIADRVFDVKGDNPVAYEGAANFLQFLLQMTSGIKISVDSSGDFYIVSTANNSRFKIGTSKGAKEISEMVFKTETSELTVDANNFSFIHKGLGFFAKFNIEDDGSASASIRIGDNTLILDSASGLQINQASGAGVGYGADGSLTLTDKNGHILSLQDGAITVNGDKDPVSIAGKIFNILTTEGLMVGAVTDDGVLKAQKTAALYDVHVHAGPAGPPIVLWTPLMLTTLMAKGIKVG
jgi:hypothetical protein